VYWGLLAPGRFPSAFALWSNTSQHALNSFCALFEIISPRTSPLPWLDIIPIVILLALYLGLAYVTHATDGFYVGILVAAIIIFLIVRYLIMLRVWVTEKKMGKAGKFSKHGTGHMVHEEPEKGVPMTEVSAK
jgi:hypothetical protein